ncbi:MAG: LptA/OstA family protein [Magnetococcales bacterium]|nr:LptA/OstA family protein [Magnetococcales bacterium]
MSDSIHGGGGTGPGGATRRMALLLTALLLSGTAAAADKARPSLRPAEAAVAPAPTETPEPPPPLPLPTPEPKAAEAPAPAVGDGAAGEKKSAPEKPEKPEKRERVTKKETAADPSGAAPAQGKSKSKSEGKGKGAEPGLEIDADRLEVDDNAHTATFTGRVEARQGGLKLTAQRMVIQYQVKGLAKSQGSPPAATAPGGSEGGPPPVVQAVTASGGVTVSDEQYQGMGEGLVYSASGRTVELTGKPARMTRGGDRLEGERIRLHLDAQRRISRMEALGGTQKRVSARITPGGGLAPGGKQSPEVGTQPPASESTGAGHDAGATGGPPGTENRSSGSGE